MTKKWLDLFLVQSSIPLSQGWLDLRSVKSPADRRTKAARRNASAISSGVISPLANGAASQRPSERRHRQQEQVAAVWNEAPRHSRRVSKMRPAPTTLLTMLIELRPEARANVRQGQYDTTDS